MELVLIHLRTEHAQRVREAFGSREGVLTGSQESRAHDHLQNAECRDEAQGNLEGTIINWQQ